MKFSEFAKYLQQLDKTTKRLEITDILVDLYKNIDKKETEIATYLALGYLKAQFDSLKFNIADKMMIKILGETYSIDQDTLKSDFSKTGDLGDVAEKYSNKNNFKDDIADVYKKLVEIAEVSGSGSQENKITLTTRLLNDADQLSSKYLVRIILGTTRLGFTELTIVDALAKYLSKDGLKDKAVKEQIESKYRVHPDIGLIARKVIEEGIKGLEHVDIEVGIPVNAQKPQRLSSAKEMIEKMDTVIMEYKFDGTRVQLHMDKNRKKESNPLIQENLFENSSEKNIFTKTFTRNLEETTHQYPDIIEAAHKQLKCTSIILDGEAIGFDKKTGEFLPFQETIQRKRKHNVESIVKEIPLKYMVFDILYLDGKSLINTPLEERRNILKEVVADGETIVVDKQIKTNKEQGILDFHKEAMDKGLEGIMIKKINSLYEAGARNYNWIKFKKTNEKLLEDTIDCVVLGYYFGKGDRAKFGLGNFLTGIWDEKSGNFLTITKVGSGLTDEGWRNLKEKADKISMKEKPENFSVSQMYKCDVWLKPEIVVEIAAEEITKSAEHSAKYALRFPRMIGYREDKSPHDTTTLKEIKDMYSRQ